MSTNEATMPLPAGWRRVASKTHPGEFYYVSPAGPTWKPPTASPLEPFRSESDAIRQLTSGSPAAAGGASPRRPDSSSSPANASSARRRRFSATSSYRASFHEHDSADVLVERADRLSRFNPSCAPHPKATAKGSSFVSTSRHDFVAHPDHRPEPPAHIHEVPGPMKPLGETSTHRTEFRPLHDDSASPRAHRSRTPPKMAPFLFESTQRASYRAGTPASGAAALPSPRKGREVIQPPPTKPDETTYTFNDASYRLPPPTPDKSPRARVSKTQKSTHGLLGSTNPALRRTQASCYRTSFTPSEEPPVNHAPEAREYAQRAWKDGMNRSVPGQFDSLYQQAYVAESQAHGQLLRSCREVDTGVMVRSKAHQELSD